MNPELISRLISLVERTGDRVVLADPQTGKAVVVLDLSSYERLCVGSQMTETAPPAVVEKEVQATAKIEELKVQKSSEIKVKTTTKDKSADKLPPPVTNTGLTDLTQDELLDKINREIAAWKTGQEKKRTEELKAAAQTAEPFSGVSAVLEEEERFYLEPIE